MPRPLELYRRDGSTNYLNRNEQFGMLACRDYENDAIKGSRQLETATRSLFRKWEQDNGFVEGAAQILLPAGYRP